MTKISSLTPDTVVSDFRSTKDIEQLVEQLKAVRAANSILEDKLADAKASNLANKMLITEYEARADEQQVMLEDQKSTAKKYRHLFDLAPVGYLSMDEDGIITKINLAGTYLLRKPSSRIVKTPFSDYLVDEDQASLSERLMTAANSHLSMKWQVSLRLSDGTQRPVMLSTSAINARKSGELVFQVVIIDIEQQLNTEKLLRNANDYLDHLAHHDPLTNLPNRTVFTDRLQSLIAVRASTSERFGVLYFDLDGFKPINDTLGHHVGDAVLCEVADRVRLNLRPCDTIARIGGDEFTVILDQPDSAEEAILRAQRIADVIRAPIVVGDETVSVTSSMGLSLYPDHATKVNELVKGADAAMYQAKNAGRDQVRVFSRESVETSSRSSTIETSLPQALPNNQLQLFYQPIYSVDTSKVVSVEALLRWQHPTLGLISPADFIPLAEKTERIIAIGKWVLETACKQARAWHDMGLTQPIAINVSTRQLLEPGFADLVSDALMRYKLKAQALEIEITESALILDQHRCRMALQQLRNAGHIVTLDDFGTGHSSLARLVHLPVARLKVDRMFIKDIDHSSPMRSVIKSIVNMAHELGLSVVSEGVEKTSQLDYLAAIGCDAVQGYMMSMAKPGNEITELLQSDHRSGEHLRHPHPADQHQSS